MKRWEILGGSLLVVFLVISRFFLLNQIPLMLPHDEAIYAMQAYSYSVQGTTLNQLQHPWELKPIDPMFAELPATMLMPGFALFHDPLFATHFIPALLGIFLPFLFGWLLYGIWKDKKIALAGIILMSFNPLLWQLSRLSYDPFLSVFFYIAGAAILVNSNRWVKLLSFPVFFLGFFQYQGLKLLLIPWVIIILALQWTVQENNYSLHDLIHVIKNKWRSYEAIIIVLCIVLVIIYIGILLPHSGASSRANFTIFTDTQFLRKDVSTNRLLSITSPLTSLFANKLTSIGDFMIQRMVGTFNPRQFFIAIDPGANGFLVWTHGLFYWLEGLFMVIGLVYLVSTSMKNKIQFAIIATSLVILNIANVINTTSEWYTFRALMVYVMLLMVGSIGLVRLWNIRFLRLVVIVVYLASIGNFTYQYFFKYPLVSIDAGKFDERLIARYAELSHDKNPHNPVIVYGIQPDFFFSAYLLYSRSLNKTNADTIGRQVRNNQGKQIQSYTLNNVTFTNGCIPANVAGTVVASALDAHPCNETGIRDVTTLLSVSSGSALIKPEMHEIVQVRDSGVLYKVYRDKLCQGIALQGFIHIQSFSQLQIDKLSPSMFCSNWFANVVGL